MPPLPTGSRRVQDRSAGVTSIEYAVLALLIAMAIVAMVALVGAEVEKPFAAVGVGLQGGP